MMQEWDQHHQRLAAQFQGSPTDLDVAVFLAWWEKRETARLGRLMAPETYASKVSALASGFSQRNHEGPWTGTSGNPVKSSLVSRMKYGYERKCSEQGYQAVAAVPLPAEGFEAYQKHCQAALLAPDVRHSQMLARRRGVTGALLWATGVRGGKEVGSLQFRHLTPPSALGTSALEVLLTKPPMPGAEWQWRLPWTKGQRHRGHATVLREQTDTWRCPIWWLRQTALYLQGRLGQVLPTHHPVFHTHYGELLPQNGASTQQIEWDVKAASKGAGLASMGYTMYSFKRGTLQHGLHVAGESREALKRRSGIVSDRTLDRYLDGTRNTRARVS